ncbi:hypothetical protein BGZ94_004448 [Podila epigama]|nr:hypothetical protein BGZ94_004448 [Podila epigama]
MTPSTSPTLRARNAKYLSNRRPGPKRSTSSLPSSSHSNKVAKATGPPISPYVVCFFLFMLSGGAIFQVLKLFGVSVDDEDAAFY